MSACKYYERYLFNAYANTRFCINMSMLPEFRVKLRLYIGRVFMMEMSS